MDEQEPTSSQPPAKRKMDRRVKLAFVIILLGGIALIWVHQRRGPSLGWGEDLDAALEQAKDDNRPVLVFFMSSPMGELAKKNIRHTLAKKSNRQAITDHKCITVKVTLDTALKDPLAKKYRIDKLPTMLLLGPNGKERNRRVGFIGETDFRNGFLDASRIEKPKSP